MVKPMTPERLNEIRRFHEEEVELANESEGFRGELVEEVHMIADLLSEVDRLKAVLSDSFRLSERLTRKIHDLSEEGAR